MNDNASPGKQLRIPGPTPIPERVLEVSKRQMINHRSPEFSRLLTEILEGLQYVLQTKNDVLVFPASGTGGLEAAVVNTLSPGEEALFCICGAFGKRWADIAEAYGARTVRVQTVPGEGVTVGAVEEALDLNPNVKKVFLTHNETSTGVTNDVPAIAAAVKSRDLLLCVDSVSGAGCLPLAVDALDLDVVVTGSQKGWMSPPGLTMIVVSPRAFVAAEAATMPRWYFDFAREKKYQDKAQTYITPPVSVLYAMHEGLRMLREEGIERVWERHARIAATIRDGVEALGLRLLADKPYRSNTVTAIYSPAADAEGLKQLTRHMKQVHGLEVAGGQDELQGRIFRIGHLGWVDDEDAVAILAALEASLDELGLKGSRNGAERPSTAAV
ncbi:MAG TPA: alanine--glyoxylate aminotransferase family protein [Chloroflexota bacterium]|nr:alanine--glyoxylate aminotransferase family protein [Chloroflexota bacterium]